MDPSSADRKRKELQEGGGGEEKEAGVVGKRRRWDSGGDGGGKGGGTAEQKGTHVDGSLPSNGHVSTATAAKATSKGPAFSLDALAKAKLALQKQKELSEKLKNLPQLKKSSTAAAPPQPPPSAAPIVAPSIPGGLAPGLVPGLLPTGGGPVIGDISSVLKAQEYAASLGFTIPVSEPLFYAGTADLMGVPGQQRTVKAPVLRLDALGREIDEKGNVVERPKAGPISTLKVNINKQKKEAFKILRPELEEDDEESPFFDPRMGSERLKLLRPRKPAFQFVEEGRFARQAEASRMRVQFGEARAREVKARQAREAEMRERGAGDANPNLIQVGERIVEQKREQSPIPVVEWWDAAILINGCYPDEESVEGQGGERGGRRGGGGEGEGGGGGMEEDGGRGEEREGQGEADGRREILLKPNKITIYVEHPVPIEPPAEPLPPPPQPLKLTKREQKKLRTQKRLAREKERQELIRQGLLEPPKPKVKMSNLMKVMASEATQDPTKMEKEVRAAAAEREQAHADRNHARKLTPAEKREKKERKLFEDGIVGSGGGEVLVSVFKVGDLSHPQTRFKVDINAQENRLSGCVVMCDEFCLVVVEGASKSVNRYEKLMLRRIDWTKAASGEGGVGGEEGEGKMEGEEEEDEKRPNSCVLVWHGCVAQSNFDKFTIQQCRTRIAARKFLEDHGVVHYWDFAENFPQE